MNPPFLINVAVTLGSLILLAAAFRLPDEYRRSYICQGMSLFLLGAASFAADLIPSGPVRSITTAVFIVAVVWFMVLGVRLHPRRSRSQ